MVQIKEFRIVMPLSVEEYQIGQLFSTAKMSAEESHGDAGVEVLKNEPFEDENGKGQYTHKIYHLGTRVPRWLRALAPSSALKLEEEAWNAYPFCKTVLTNPFLTSFRFEITSKHLPDRGETENTHNLEGAELKKRVVQHIDIIEPHKDFEGQEDPVLIHSEKCGRGPFEEGWQEGQDPVMCCYKLVQVEFRMWGFQTKAENLMMGYEYNIFLKFHKQIIGWLDEWIDMDLKAVRKYETKMNAKVNSKMADVVGEENLAVDVNAIEDVEEEEEEEDAGNDEEAEKKKKKKKKKKKAEATEETTTEVAGSSETASENVDEEAEKKKKKKKKKKPVEEAEE